MIMINIVEDWKINSSNLKSLIVITLYRIAFTIRNNKLLVIILFPYLVFYRFFVEWILGVELPWSLKAGKGLRLEHGQALIVHGRTTIGNYCTLRHSTTIGIKKTKDGKATKSPTIGNNVDIGSNVCIIGDITIGDNVKIGAGTIVVKDIPSNSIVVGNPGRIIPNVNL